MLIMGGVMLAVMLHLTYERYYLNVYNAGYESGVSDSVRVLDAKSDLMNTMIKSCRQYPASCASVIGGMELQAHFNDRM